MDRPGDAPALSRRRALQGAVAAVVGATTWQTPSLRSVDLRGARAAASSAGIAASVTATSSTRTQGGNEFQHWGPAGGGQSTTYTVPFASGDVRIIVAGRVTRRTNGQPANGTWNLVVNAVPDGCTTCVVTNISMTCPSGTVTVSGVPGTSGDARCLNASLPEPTNASATFTVTCT